MSDMYINDDFDERRAKRKAKMRNRQKRQELLQHRMIIAAILAIVALIVIVVVIKVFSGDSKKDNKAESSSDNKTATEAIADDSEKTDDKEDEVVKEQKPPYYAEVTADTIKDFPESTCEYAVIVRKNDNTILAGKNYDVKMYPASMTKVMTVLVAAKYAKNLDDVCTVTRQTTDFCYVNDCSNVGYEVGEKVKVRELFYGTILPSGADAALTLAEYVSGSHEAFVELMNKELEEMGLSETTHFTNCVGIYDDNHYSTAYDMAMILEAAMDNEFCAQVLSEHIHTTQKTNVHKEEQSLSNLFLRRVEDKDCGSVTVKGAKTGYVTQAGNCCVSCGVDDKGNEYYLCTAKSTGNWQCIYDHAAIYKYISELNA